MAMSTLLIVIGGLPGTGKTSLARGLARALDAVHLRIDTIEQALRSATMGSDAFGTAGYVVGYGVAADNLRLGRTVVADAVNPLTSTRAAWREVARGGRRSRWSKWKWSVPTPPSIAAGSSPAARICRGSSSRPLTRSRLERMSGGTALIW